MYAHSVDSRPEAEWEPLRDHLVAVGEFAGDFAKAFGWAEVGRTAGFLHDIGKASASFQRYIATPLQTARGPDHSTAGAREASLRYGKSKSLGRMLAYAIAGHHAGLADAQSLTRRLGADYAIEPYDAWETHAPALPALDALRPAWPLAPGPDVGFTSAFLTRMLFSCLVDADFLATERFYARAAGETVRRGGHAPIAELRDRLLTYMTALRASAPDTTVNRWRARVLDGVLAKAGLAPGFFTLTVPTGGGKTLASLSFALEHAVRHGMRRIVYVIPFTSIIEQTAAVFRTALATHDDVLEHHASFDWERAQAGCTLDDEGRDGLAKLRRAAENWDVPIVVTTAVQFFESLFAARPSTCRKLHNLAPRAEAWIETTARRAPIGNLLRNAAEASPTGGEILITADFGNGAWSVCIDNAGGVPAAIRDRFFDKYVTSGKERGTGLGTYSAKLMAEVQGGSIHLSGDADRTQLRIR